MSNINLAPLDAHNQALLSHVHPADWVNPEPEPIYNLVVIGAGAAGLISAAAAAGLGGKVALIEKSLMGGDCLNIGCVPSKSLIASAHYAEALRGARAHGYQIPDDIDIDFATVMERLRAARTTIAPNDSAARFRDMGMDVFLGEGKFTGPNTVEVDGKTLAFKKAVVATGGRAALPPVNGLEDAAPLTNETVFNLEEQPESLAIIGAGPIGCELAQSFARLGTKVYLFEYAEQILTREDPDAAKIVADALQEDGVELIVSARLQQVARNDASSTLTWNTDSEAETQTLHVAKILVGAGRTPNVNGIGLEQAGVDFDERQGVIVNDQLRSTNKHIYAVGDVCMQWKFTHAADAAARIMTQNAFFFGRKKVSQLVMPWVTYTSPEVAHVGLYERDADEQGIAIDTFIEHFSHNDRAIAEGNAVGFAKIHVKRGTDTIVGATVVGPNAGDILAEVTLAMTHKIGLGKIASVIHPYPTRGDIIKRLADAYNRTRLSPRVSSLFQRWFRWLRR